jgi:hypothetical protein
VRAYGTPGTGAGQFSMLRRVAVGTGTSPKVFGADLWNYKIEVFASSGAYLRMFGGKPPPPAPSTSRTAWPSTASTCSSPTWSTSASSDSPPVRMRSESVRTARMG